MEGWKDGQILFYRTLPATVGGPKSKVTKDENSENVPHLKITEVVIIYCNIVKNDYQ